MPNRNLIHTTYKTHVIIKLDECFCKLAKSKERFDGILQHNV